MQAAQSTASHMRQVMMLASKSSSCDSHMGDTYAYGAVQMRERPWDNAEVNVGNCIQAERKRQPDPVNSFHGVWHHWQISHQDSSLPFKSDSGQVKQQHTKDNKSCSGVFQILQYDPDQAPRPVLLDKQQRMQDNALCLIFSYPLGHDPDTAALPGLIR